MPNNPQRSLTKTLCLKARVKNNHNNHNNNNNHNNHSSNSNSNSNTNQDRQVITFGVTPSELFSEPDKVASRERLDGQSEYETTQSTQQPRLPSRSCIEAATKLAAIRRQSVLGQQPRSAAKTEDQTRSRNVDESNRRDAASTETNEETQGNNRIAKAERCSKEGHCDWVDTARVHT